MELIFAQNVDSRGFGRVRRILVRMTLRQKCWPLTKEEGTDDAAGRKSVCA